MGVTFIKLNEAEYLEGIYNKSCKGELPCGTPIQAMACQVKSADNLICEKQKI